MCFLFLLILINCINYLIKEYNLNKEVKWLLNMPNLNLNFKSIKESINNQIIEMKNNVEKSKNYIKTSVDIIEKIANYKYE